MARANHRRALLWQAGLLNLPTCIQEITSCELGVDLKLEGGQKHPAGKNRSICWTATFASTTDYEIYETHEAHLQVITYLIKPVLEPGTRAAVQYEFSSAPSLL